MWLLANHPGSFASLIRQPLAGEIAFSTPITV